MTGNRQDDVGRRALEASLIAGAGIRSDMEDFGPSCFHSASTGFRHAKAPRLSGAQGIDIVSEFWLRG